MEGGGEGEAATPAAKVTSNFDYNQEVSIGEIVKLRQGSGKDRQGMAMDGP